MDTSEKLDNVGFIIEHDVNLSEFTTFRLGGPCPGLIRCHTPFELERAVQFLNQEGHEFILIGGGSNLVVSDQGLDCFVIRYVSNTALIERDGCTVKASASTKLDDLARFCSNQGLGGLICATGIPGTVGGAVVGNAGAFGRQIGDVVKHIDVMDKKGNRKQLSHDELGFSYRHSKLRELDYLILSVTLELVESDSEGLIKDRKEILAMRKTKHPNLEENPCAGSFFRNIEPTSDAGQRQAAGWFLEQAGGKKLKYGGARIYEKHANIIVKGDDCSAQDVYALSQRMQRLIKQNYNIDLIREVKFVGNFFGKPAGVTSIIW